jgi:murein DD-endopeptidase MepM/ murein hydrolase activator NlpD
MTLRKFSSEAGMLSKFRQLFRSRELFIHDGAAMRRVHVSARAQVISASAVAATLMVSAFGITQFAVGASAMSGAISTFASRQADVRAMERRVASLQNDVTAIKAEARTHVARLEARQAFLASVLKGDGNTAKLAAMMPASSGAVAKPAREVAALFSGIESNQAWMAGVVRQAADAKYRNTATMVAKLGMSPARFDNVAAMGGPYEPISASAQPADQPVVAKQADPQFKALFQSWKKLDQLQASIVAIPSARPVPTLAFTSNYGVRTDPFRGGAAMHSGVDIPGAYATPIYATADGIVGRTGRVGGYGNLVEIEHGRGIQTRYGHLSSMLVAPGKKVKRGDLIALMGSTGRSTGNHLHYEVRIDGRAVNPAPFLQTSDYLVAMQRRAGTVAMGGPVEKTAAAK